MRPKSVSDSSSRVPSELAREGQAWERTLDAEDERGPLAPATLPYVAQLLQQGQKALAVAHPSRKTELPGLEAELHLDRVLALVLAGAQRQLLPVDLVQRDFRGVQIADHPLDLVGAQPAGIQPPNDGAHAGAHQPLDAHPIALKPPQHRQVCKALGPTAGQHHDHAWPAGP